MRRLACSMGWILMFGCGGGGGDDAATAGTDADDGADAGSASDSTADDATATASGGGEGGYCPGVGEVSEPTCSTNDDCEDLLSCVFTPSDCPGPGCESDCDVDADCGDPAVVCVKSGVGCCGDAGLCTPACTPEACAADETCEADGHCTPIPCDAGYECAEGWMCAPGADGGDRHGCVIIPCDQAGASECPLVHECVGGVCQRIACAQHADCPCGSCVAAQCWERPWICVEEPA